MTTSPASPRGHLGELHVFLGAAPGVGKTYAMLREGHRLRDDGHDVVIGYIETHGRAETAALVEGLEVVPRRQITYKSLVLEEMDVDAILARAPQIALVDELAHTNAAGSRHAKRWQDIDELRQAGIDVITTLNIQHVNELADVVAGITGVTVKETVPYRVLEGASDVQVVDLPVDELIARLERGKIYPPGRARQALEHFFRRGNLTALRELALRWTAAGIDDQLTGMMLPDARGSVEASERVMVLMSAETGWGVVMRNAWRLASALHAELGVLIPPPSDELSPEAWHQAIAAHRQLAEDLGATLLDIPAGQQDADPDAALGAALSAHHATILVAGVTRTRGGWRRQERLAGIRTVERVLLAVPRIDIHLVMMDEGPGGA